MTTIEAIPVGTEKKDHTGNIIVGAVGAVLCGLIIFTGTVEVLRTQFETKIEQTYDVKIIGDIRDSTVEVDGWGGGAYCHVPANDAEFAQPMKCKITTTDAIELAPSAFRKTSSPR
jgi:hypothetical protein